LTVNSASGRLSLKQLFRNKSFRERFSFDRFKFGEKHSVQPITLSHRRIFILPTASGLGCAVLIIAMLSASTVYGNNLGFILTFLLASLVVVSILHSFRALSGLRFSTKECHPVYAGDMAIYDCQIENPTNSPRISVGLSVINSPRFKTNIDPYSLCKAQLPIKTIHRGWQKIGTVTIDSLFPLGLFRAWSPIKVDEHILVYPHPTDNQIPLPNSNQSISECEQERTYDDDFTGFRQYTPGDSVKHIYWKAMAKEQGLHTKEYSGDQNSLVWLEWSRTPGHSVEDRLSQMCRWVLDADQSGATYGLRLPDNRLGPDSGETHRALCLQALALFDHADAHV